MEIVETAAGTFIGFLSAQFAIGQIVKYTLRRKRNRQLDRLAEFEQQLRLAHAESEGGIPKLGVVDGPHD